MLNKKIMYILPALLIVNIALAGGIKPKGSLEQLTYIKASNTDAFDVFGTTIALSDDTLVVGAWGEASTAVGVNGNGSDNSYRNNFIVWLGRKVKC